MNIIYDANLIVLYILYIYIFMHGSEKIMYETLHIKKKWSAYRFFSWLLDCSSSGSGAHSPQLPVLYNTWVAAVCWELSPVENASEELVSIRFVSKMCGFFKKIFLTLFNLSSWICLTHIFNYLFFVWKFHRFTAYVGKTHRNRLDLCFSFRWKGRLKHWKTLAGQSWRIWGQEKHTKSYQIFMVCMVKTGIHKASFIIPSHFKSQKMFASEYSYLAGSKLFVRVPRLNRIAISR